MKNTNNYDDYLDELVEGIGEPPSNLAATFESSVHINTTKTVFDDANLVQQCPKEHLVDENHVFNNEKESDMDSLDTRPILNPQTPRESADIFINMHQRQDGLRDLQCVPSSGDFYVWKDNYYRPIADLSVQSRIARFLHNAVRIVISKDSPEEKKVPFNTDSAKEHRVLDALKCIACDGIEKDPAIAPHWIFAFNPDELPNPENLIPFKNKLLSIDDFLKDGNSFNCLHKVTPKFFCSTQIPFNIDPHDHKRLLPVKFLAFLGQVFDNDQSSIDFLQQWFGYCLTNDTWAQKILLMVGPKRSGKGTIARVLQAMLGSENFIAPSASGMISTHGMESWLNKRLAVFGDARFGDKIDKDAVKELLLQISGEDYLTIARKFKSSVSTKLPTKIMILSNEIPDIKDSGAALASRFMVLKMQQSFHGKEIVDLFDKQLKPEIPLIFWWALDGLRSLMASKRFTQAEGGKESANLMERMQSPITAFVSDFCNVRPEISIDKEVLYAGYERWCKQEDISPLSKNFFARFLFSAFHTVKATRPRQGDARLQMFQGICLKDRS